MKAVILGISFSTRMIGLAVLEPPSLIDYSVKFHKGKWSPAKMNSILTSLTSAVKHYNITHIVLSIAPAYYRSEPFQELWQEMVIQLRALNIPLSMHRLTELQALVGYEERMTRKLLMNGLAELYPQLAVYAKIEGRNKNKYYYKMFEAIGVATLYSREME